MSNTVVTLLSPPNGSAGNNTHVVADEAAMLALNANVGDLAIRTDIDETFVLTALPPSELANWQNISIGGVESFGVPGRTGAVVPTNADYTTSLVAEGTRLYHTAARARTAVQKVNLATGYTLAGGTTSKTLTMLDDASLNQSLLTSSNVRFQTLDAFHTLPDLRLTYSLDSNKLGIICYDSTLGNQGKTDGCVVIKAIDQTINTQGVRINGDAEDHARVSLGRAELDNVPAVDFDVFSAVDNLHFHESGVDADLGVQFKTSFKTKRYTENSGGSRLNSQFCFGLLQNDVAFQDKDRAYWGLEGHNSTDFCEFIRTGHFSFNSDIDSGDLVYINGTARFGNYARYDEIAPPALINAGFGVFANSADIGKPYVKLKQSATPVVDLINGGTVGQVAKVANYEILHSDKFVQVDTTAGNITLNWNPALLKNHSVTIKKVAGTNDVILLPDSGLIDGQASVAIEEVDGVAKIAIDGVNTHLDGTPLVAPNSVVLPELVSAPPLPDSGNTLFTFGPNNVLHARGEYVNNGSPVDRVFGLDNAAGRVIIVPDLITDVALDRSNQFITVDASSNTVTIHWNQAHMQGKIITVKLIAGANNVILEPDTGDIEGAATFSFNTLNQAVTFICDGVDSWVVAS